MSQKGVPKNKPKISQTHPEFVKWMQNKEDAKEYSYGSNFKINWICPNCGEKYEVDYDNYGHCPKCGQRLTGKKARKNNGRCEVFERRRQDVR